MTESQAKVFNPVATVSILPHHTSKAGLPEAYHAFDSLDPITITCAYEHCRQTIQHGSKGFYFATRFLPPAQRRAVWAVYSFCRYTDDVVDNASAKNISTEEIRHRLAEWETELQRSYEGYVRPNMLHMIAWQHAVRQFSIPAGPARDLIEGVRMDLTQSRYASFEELRLYCYRVASTVGLMASEIIGYSDPCAIEYAIDLGIAMQLTNILRDVGEDARMGRIYLPQDELAEFGYSETQLLKGEINSNFIALMQFQIDRARQYYQRALPGIEYLDKKCRLSISVAAHLYSQILNVIERNSYNVFTRRAYVPFGEKLQGLSQVWWRRHISQASLIDPALLMGRSEEADA